MNFDNSEMPTATAIRTILTYENVKMNELANRLGKSKQTVSMKFSQGDFKESDLKKIGDALGYDVIIQFKKKE